VTKRPGEMTRAVKGLPVSGWELSNDEIGSTGWNVAKGDLPLPVLTISRSAVEHNIDVMARWCSEHKCLLAPHGKTTMAPDLFRRQLDAGAWGITVATVRQAAVAVRAGANRVIIANEVVDDVELKALCDLLDDPALTICVFVDSSTGVELLAAAGKRSGHVMPAMVEVGVVGGRTGVRGEDEFLDLLRLVVKTDHVDLLGVSAFEGVLPTERDEHPKEHPITQESSLRAFLIEVSQYIARAQAETLLSRESIVTAGGSLAFDLVVEILGPLTETLILRSGCYVTHDHGMYALLSPLSEAPEDGNLEGVLLPALNVWARVTSAPESGLAIVGFGKRDANEDVNPPVPLVRLFDSGAREVVTDWRVDRMWDQHARLRSTSDAATQLNVGDAVTFGISHPCTALDKWRAIVEIDEFDNVVGAIETYF
jgi:D-serine dehydratase